MDLIITLTWFAWNLFMFMFIHTTIGKTWIKGVGMIFSTVVGFNLFVRYGDYTLGVIESGLLISGMLLVTISLSTLCFSKGIHGIQTNKREK